jgi:hypothetical protein
VRCIHGCKECRRIYEPVPEMCDDIDNDCNCEEDDGSPDRMGPTPPRWGALLTDFSAPARLGEEEIATVWVEFRNMGSETWRPGEVWLVSTSAMGGEPSPLYAAGGWLSWQIAAQVDDYVRPGESAVIELSVQAADLSLPEVADEFQLVLPDGREVKCPESSVSFSVLITRSVVEEGEDDPPARPDAGGPAGTQQLTGGCSCSFVD